MQFSGKVEKVMGENGWHVVVLPPEVTQHLRDEAGKKGNIPVAVTIGKTAYSTTIMSMGNQQWFFAIKTEIRKAEAIAEGDRVEVKIVPDVKRLNKENI